MKIFLFRPNSEVITALPPMGLLSLAAYLRKDGKNQLRVFDGRLHCSTHHEVCAQIAEFQPDLIGIGLLSMERQVGHNAINFIRHKFPRIPIVMGGPYPSSDPGDAMSNEGVDFAVLGEGEVIADNLAEALVNGADLHNLKGLVFRDNGVVKINEREDYIQDLDALPMTAWDLINLQDYFARKGRSTQMNIHKKYLQSAPIQTSRGCPFRCTYCHNLFGKKLRYRSIPNILVEMKFLKDKYGLREIEIIDDSVNLNIKRFKEFFRAIIDSSLNLSYCFPNGLRADVMDEEAVDLMKEAGVYRLVYAIESGSPRIQKAIRKNLDLEKAQKIITYTAKKGISVGSFYMMGFLNETEADMRMTINFALKSKAHTASFFLLNPFPNTEIYKQAIQNGYNLDNVKFMHYYSLCTNISQVPSRKMLKMRSQAYRHFFLNPVRIFNFFRTTPSKFFIFKKVLVALLLFFIQIQEEKKARVGTQVTEGEYKRNLLMRLIYYGANLQRLEKESRD